jgi:TatD DNase family protein
VSMWFDSHCHLDLPGFDESASALWAKAQQQGVSHAFVPGVEPEQWSKLEALRCLPGIVTGVGLHPFTLERWSHLPEDLFARQLSAALTTLLSEGHAHTHVAIGECGWDKSLAKRCPRINLELQTRVVLAHIHVARDTGLPLVLHVVHAHGLALQVLQDHPLPAGGVVHAYSGAPELVIRYQRLGFRLGFGPPLLRYPKVAAALKVTAPDYLLLETDAPLSPGWTTWCDNSPAAVLSVGEAASEILSLPVAEVAARTSLNCMELFRAIH